MIQPFQGLVAAPFTPFYPDYTLNLEVISAYAAHLRRMGIGAVFICGTTGEGPSLTLNERMKVAETWMREARPDFRIIVHAGHTQLDDARRIAAHAADINAAAVSAVAPYFFKPRNAEELTNWCAVVAEAAPGLPFYYYHIPSLTGVNMPVRDFLRCAGPRIPSLAGVKYTHEDLEDYAACREFAQGRFDLLFGRDELLLEGLDCGAQGAVGSTYNYAAPLYHRLIKAHRDNDRPEARRLQDLAIRMIQICQGTKATHLAASKTLMASLGIDCGPVRLPLTPPPEEQTNRMRRELEEAGLFEFIRLG